MEKTYKMIVALVLTVLGAMGVSAGERIPLTTDGFFSHTGWHTDAVRTGAFAGASYVIGEPVKDCAFGDSNCEAYLDLSAYSKLYVKAVGCEEDGTPNGNHPRIFINMYKENGANVNDKIVLVQGAGKYCTIDDDGTYVVDLKAIAKDYGCVYLSAVKGSGWGQWLILTSIEVEQSGKAQQIGWTNILNNSDFEGDDISSFRYVLNGSGSDGNATYDPVIEDGVGVDGGRGLTITSSATAAETWSTQLFVVLPEVQAAGTPWRFSMDVMSSEDAEVSVGGHANPREWKCGGADISEAFANTLTTGAEWKTITAEGTISEKNVTDGFKSIAFDLNLDKEKAIEYHFDNIRFEVYKYGTTAKFSNDVVLVDFGFKTNIADLVKTSGKTRLMYPKDCATVKVNGETVGIYSVEALPDGRFYIFLDNPVSADDEVVVSFKNPADEALHILYTSGPLGDANSFSDVVAELDADIENNEGYPYDYITPVLVKADPETGSFNLPNSIKDFKVAFDKEVDCAALEATINGAAMTKTPAEGYATEITLTRAGDADLATGEYTIHLTKIYPQLLLAEEVFGDTTIVVNVGKVEYDPTDVPEDIIPVDYFNNCAANSVPEGFLLFADGETPEQRVPGGNYGSGARMMDFAAGGDFTKGLYMRTWYVEYGTLEGHALTLKAGKRYNVTFNSCQWAGAGHWMKFQILKDDLVVFSQMVENNPNVNEKKDAVNGSTFTSLTFVPEEDGDYVAQWVVATGAEGNPTNNAWQNGVILANVKMTYMPNQVGFEETMLLNTALANAKATRDGNADERFAGEAITALNAAIEKYEAEKENYTSPTQFKEAAATLDAASQAVKDHRQLCDNYDTQIKLALDVVRQVAAPDDNGKPNAKNKFMETDLYTELCGIVAKYNGKSEWRDVADHEGEDPENPVAANFQLFYEYDKLTDDAALKAAIAELTDIANKTNLLFTVGKSTPDNSNGGKGTGVAVLTERLRLGAEALKALGVADDDALVVSADKALTDDDALAKNIQLRLKEIVYGQLKEAGNTLFEATVDPNTFEEITPSYDMTVFVKNPNIYKQLPNMDFGYNEAAGKDNVPGWVVPEGFQKPGLSTGWSSAKNIEGVAEDCMFQTWGAAYRAEQTIEGLPAGIYTVKMAFGERESSEEPNLATSYVYAKTTATPAAAEGEPENFAGTATATVIGQAFPFADGLGSMTIEGITVDDGILTIGVNGGPSSHTFFNEVRILMTGSISGFDYASAHAEAVQEIADGIEVSKAQPAQARAIELYTLDGRRIATAQKGIVIVKKYMNDGTVRTEKVIRK